MTLSGDMKRCRKCREWKAVAEYPRARKSADGLAGDCRSCRAAYEAQRRDQRGAASGPVRRDSQLALLGADEIQARCRGCDALKPLTEFVDSPRHRSGKLSLCKQCNTARVTEWRARDPERTKELIRASYFRHRKKRRARAAQYYRENRERLLAQARSWALANPEARRLIVARYHEAHRTEEREYRRRYSRKHRARINAKNQRWRKANPDKVRAENFRRRATDLDQNARDYLAVIRNDPCAYCGGPATEVDHIVPLARGGTNDWDNFTAACRTCNSSKCARPLLDFLAVGVPS